MTKEWFFGNRQKGKVPGWIFIGLAACYSVAMVAGIFMFIDLNHEETTHERENKIRSIHTILLQNETFILEQINQFIPILKEDEESKNWTKILLHKYLNRKINPYLQQPDRKSKYIHEERSFALTKWELFRHVLLEMDVKDREGKLKIIQSCSFSRDTDRVEYFQKKCSAKEQELYFYAAVCHYLVLARHGKCNESRHSETSIDDFLKSDRKFWFDK